MHGTHWGPRALFKYIGGPDDPAKPSPSRWRPPTLTQSVSQVLGTEALVGRSARAWHGPLVTSCRSSSKCWKGESSRSPPPRLMKSSITISLRRPMPPAAPRGGALQLLRSRERGEGGLKCPFAPRNGVLSTVCGGPRWHPLVAVLGGKVSGGPHRCIAGVFALARSRTEGQGVSTACWCSTLWGPLVPTDC